MPPMSEPSGQTTSVWMATASVPEFPPLSESIDADVCVVGGGIAGLSTAYFLAREGQRVAVLDDGAIATGQTERTTAHLSNAIDDRIYEIERLFGEAGARLAVESHGAAIDRIEQIVREEAIACDFARLDGYLFTPPGQSDDVLHRELDAAHRAGLGEVELVDRAPLVSYPTGAALLFPRQGQFHALKYCAGLAAAIVRHGGRIFGHTRAGRLQGGRQAFVETTHGWRITCRAIVIATNSPINDRVALHTRQRPYRTYAIGVTVPMGTVPQVLYWDTEDPYHYVRLQPADAQPGRPSRDLLIVGGEDHETGQADASEERFARLEAWTRERFPMAGEVRYQWSGQVLETIDGLAHIGRNPMDADNVFVATGDSGQGMTHGTIAGMLLTDLILGRPNRWAQLYNPERVVPQAAREFVSDNVQIAQEYLKWLKPGDVEGVNAISRGCGAVLRRGLEKVAIYRDDDGQLHECSAVCPHLGGIVTWNDVEKTWDCPVHGSRFDRLGHVVNGPANQDLAALRKIAGHGA